MQPPSRESSSANEPPNKESISCEQVQFGVDSILQSSEFRPRADALKGSVIETLAAQHGMSHIALPIDDNVTYHHWTLGDIQRTYQGQIPWIYAEPGTCAYCPQNGVPANIWI
ncbi:hypothetical protein DPMN_130221 [Dreissena polymorpha]|uniref:Uncharacterized protein n=1 Tax=Dreissena polymorpha TaxID=45954 RepID=A0A9D4H6F0_DREPO|nr:hypothetical protein DPMN_130221 [Dreissena polymorpha]